MLFPVINYTQQLSSLHFSAPFMVPTLYFLVFILRKWIPMECTPIDFEDASRNLFKILKKQRDDYTWANFPKRSPSLRDRNPSLIISVVPGRHPQLRWVNVKRENNHEQLAGSWLNVSSDSTEPPAPPPLCPQPHFQSGKQRRPLIHIVSLELGSAVFSSDSLKPVPSSGHYCLFSH